MRTTAFSRATYLNGNSILEQNNGRGDTPADNTTSQTTAAHIPLVQTTLVTTDADVRRWSSCAIFSREQSTADGKREALQSSGSWLEKHESHGFKKIIVSTEYESILGGRVLEGKPRRKQLVMYMRPLPPSQFSVKIKAENRVERHSRGLPMALALALAFIRRVGSLSLNKD